MKNIFDLLYEDDMKFGDITSELIVPQDLTICAKVIAKEDGIIAGVEYLSEKIDLFDLKMKVEKKDGETIHKGDVVVHLEGNAQKILAVERVFLNILGRMSGIATASKRMVEKVRNINSKVRIAATRKTLFGMLDKVAVKIGGGDMHRWGLSDHILIKDNHLALVELEEAINKVKNVSFVRKVEVEVETVEDAIIAAELGVDIIMLDNFTPSQIKEVVEILRNKDLRDNVLLEASGRINEDNIESYAKYDLDIISMGFITHSAKSLDFSMDFK